MSRPDWFGAIAEAYRSDAAVRTDGSVIVRRVRGGANNALYHVIAGGEQYACKLCVVDERRRAAPEYGALRMLQEAGLDLAPEPIPLDTSCTALPFPVVIYRWLPGEPLGPSLAPERLASLLASTQGVHSIRRTPHVADALPDAFFHWFDYRPYLAELRGFLARYGGWLASDEPAGRRCWL